MTVEIEKGWREVFSAEADPKFQIHAHASTGAIPGKRVQFQALKFVVVTPLGRKSADVAIAATRLPDFFKKNPNPFEVLFGVLGTELVHVIEKVAVSINELVPTVFKSASSFTELLILFIDAWTPDASLHGSERVDVFMRLGIR
jgi:hypothetical protein